MVHPILLVLVLKTDKEKEKEHEKEGCGSAFQEAFPALRRSGSVLLHL